MPPSNKSSSKKAAAATGEIQVQKSPAEFFAENQAIAGFDNLGKSLYTSLRELVENSLDACENIGVLPDVSVHITEYTVTEFNKLRGLGESPRKNQKDTELFAKKGKKKKQEEAAAVMNASQETTASTAAADKGKKKTKRKSMNQEAYFSITVRDNGCGMSHNAIPNLLGRVLSGSKVRDVAKVDA